LDSESTSGCVGFFSYHTCEGRLISFSSPIPAFFFPFPLPARADSGQGRQGAVGSQAPIMAHVLRSVDIDSPSLQTFCSTVFGLCSLQDVKPRSLEFSAPSSSALTRRDGADGGGEPETGEGGVRRKRWESKGGEPFQVVHFSESHIDWKYAVRLPQPLSSSSCDVAVL
jgi:sphingomyelin phosphodiesterase